MKQTLSIIILGVALATTRVFGDDWQTTINIFQRILIVILQLPFGLLVFFKHPWPKPAKNDNANRRTKLAHPNK